MTTRRIRRFSLVTASVLAAAGLATGATAAFADDGGQSPKVRLVVNEGGQAKHSSDSGHQDCPGKDGSEASEASDASSEL